MKYSSSVLLAGYGLINTVASHGFLTSPQPRLAGAAMKTTCGEQLFSQQTSDNYGNIQGMLQVAANQADYDEAACNIWQCKGFKYADNTANVQSWTAGQSVDFKFDVRAPHTGYANVSIVNTATNSIIGDQLLYYSDFGDNSKSIPANETSFSITIPSDIGDTCSTAGACVVQHFWNAASIDQTYESCVDFVVGGSGSSTPASSSSAAVVVSSAASSSSSAPSITKAATSAIQTTSAVSEASTTSAITYTTEGAAVESSNTAVPTTLQTKTSSKSSTPSTTASAVPISTGITSKVQLPAGTTLGDLLSWVSSWFTTNGGDAYTGSTVI